MTLGEQVRTQREFLGFSRLDVAQKFSPMIDPKTLQRWESGETTPSDDRCRELAKILGGQFAPPRFVFPNGSQR